MTSKRKPNAKTEVLCELHDREAALEDQKCWTVRIPPGPPTVLGKLLYRLTMVLKNRGPGSIWVNTGYINDEVRLQPGQTRVIAIKDQIQIVITDGHFAVCDFEIMHAVK